MISDYLKRINKRYKTGISTEHSYRGDLQTLLGAFSKEVLVTNEPTRIDCGAPDYIVTKKNIPIGYIEAKDIGVSLKNIDKTDQLKRYKSSLDNLILTDYLDFWIYRNGKLVTSVSIAEIKNKKITPLSKNHKDFENLIQDFYAHIYQTITSSSNLAEMMAGKARMMQAVIDKALTSDEENEQDSSLKDQMMAFKRILIHDIKPSEFADIYAQTIAYGMFAARLNDPTLDDFSRQEAAELIPKTNPFLRRLFSYIAGPDIDDRIKWIVDALADIFRATNVAELMKNFGSSTHVNNPIIHFYETFLTKYNPKLRKARGVWYTPEPVVNYIVRAVDGLLKTEFGLKDGLANTSKTTIKVKAQGTTITKGRNKGKPVFQSKEIHKVQILDPATGTGTFLAEVVKFIYNKKFKAMQGAWSGYVEEHLIPRLNGFELLMASYSMAHLSLDLLLNETGYTPKKEQRFNIYLTNSLEEHHPDTGTLFASWLSSEANEANHIKRDKPVMVVLGNPPYSGESANKGEWIMNLMEDYKKEPGGKEKLKERNPKWINDDYVKFLRYGQQFIEKNGEGILAFINSHSFLDNPTFRGMRWHLLNTYDKIFILDLHGNSKKKETCPDGSPDVNVFDIQQGVSINFFVKTGRKNPGELGQVYHCDLFGERDAKYHFLWENTIKSVSYQKIPNIAPMYFMVQKDFEKETIYNVGIDVKNLFRKDSMGVTTGADSKLVSFVDNFSDEFVGDYTEIYSYRPFDNRFVYYNSKFLARSRSSFMEELKNKENIALCMIRRDRGKIVTTPYCAKNLIDKCIVSSLDNANIFPLYTYPEADRQRTIEKEKGREPNLDPEITQKIAGKLGLTFTKEKDDDEGVFTPIDILDYIYAILHSPIYRETYKEFLKIDFPRVPYPKDKKTFWQLVKLGGEVRQIHLLESDKVEDYITSYPEDGDNVITRKINKKDWELYDKENQLGRIWINDTQYFDQIPLTAWEFYIGGYQPAQKWLKDRKGRELTFDDILHYQKIVVALVETDNIMRKIDKIDFM